MIFLADQQRKIRPIDLRTGAQLSIIPLDGPPRVIGADCATQTLYVVEQSASLGTPPWAVHVIQFPTGTLVARYPLPRTFLPRRTVWVEDSDTLYINGIQSPAGQTGGEYWSQKTADRYYDDFTLGLRVSLGTGNTEPMLAPYEDRCIGAGACLSVSMARQGSTRVVALPTSRRVAVYRGAETPPTLLDITSPEFIRTDQILPPNASAETRVRWLSENSTIGMVLPFADRIATFHSQARLEPDRILGQFIDRTVFMNVHAYDGTRLRTDVAVPELPVGNDDTSATRSTAWCNALWHSSSVVRRFPGPIGQAFALNSRFASSGSNLSARIPHRDQEMPDNVHFRCTFDVQAAAEPPVDLANLVKEIASWIRSKEGRSLDLSPNWLLRAGSSRRRDGKATVTTDSLPDDSPPELWALRYEHQDVEFHARRWVIDFGLARTETERWRISTTISHSLHPNYIGKEPGLLPVTPPRVIRALLASDHLQCQAGTCVLLASSQVVQVGKADHLVRAIEDPGRACPIVYISANRLTGEPMIDPARLASTIAGTGIVFVAAGPDIDDELEFLLVPREFRSPNGTVRVYAPGANFRLAQQAYRHRFFTRIQISEQSALEVEGQIARALTRRQAWAGVRSSVTSIDDLAQRRRESRLAALQHQSDQASKDERLQIFHEDNTRLSRVATELTKSNEALEERLGLARKLALQLRRVCDLLACGDTRYGSRSAAGGKVRGDGPGAR